jgi:hypothetical protein
MQQDAFVAVDVGDAGIAGGGRDEARVVGEVAVGRELAHVDDVGANRPAQYRQVDGLAVDGKLGSLAPLIGHASSLKDLD